MTQETIESLVHIRREDLTVEEDTDFIVKELCVEIANLKQLLQIRKEMNDELSEENADLRRQLLFDEE